MLSAGAPDTASGVARLGHSPGGEGELSGTSPASPSPGTHLRPPRPGTVGPRCQVWGKRAAGAGKAVLAVFSSCDGLYQIMFNVSKKITPPLSLTRAFGSLHPLDFHLGLSRRRRRLGC